jgi:hypothetical protein
VRQREVEELRASLDDISACHGRLAFTERRAGIGKTRFASPPVYTSALGSTQNREAG